MATWHQQQNKSGHAALYAPPAKGYRVVIDPPGNFASSVDFATKRAAQRYARRSGGVIIPATAKKEGGP